MKLTTTNGNARNGLPGQRVRFTCRNGHQTDVMLPAGNAARRKAYRGRLYSEACLALRLEAGERHGVPRSQDAADLLSLFVQCKASVMINHNRRSIGHA